MSFLNLPKTGPPAAGLQPKLGQGSLSKKVNLEKGYSLHDWIAVHNDHSRDLTSIGGGFKRVSIEELQAHNQMDNAWTCIRGKVYNMAPYMRYHPGGVDELMKAAGRDGTYLFEEAHAWVNPETMLRRCIVGQLVGEDLSAIQERLKAKAKASEAAAVDEDPGIGQGQKPRFDWYQSKDVVHVVFMTQYGLKEENIITSLDSSGSLLEVVAVLGPSSSYVFKVQLHDKVLASQGVKVRVKNGNAQISMVKAEEGKWPQYGEVLAGNGLVSNREVHFHDCSVVDIQQVTHDTKVYQLRLPPAVHFKVPVGHHVIVQVSVQGMELTNPYTVVQPLSSTSSDSASTEADGGEDQSTDFYLMIKIYPNGVVTPHVGKLAVGDTLRVSEPQGSFDAGCLDDIDNVAMIAMGTGFTPMTSVTAHCLASHPNSKLHLLFSNRSETDILWRQELTDAVSRSAERFSVQHILSQASDSWTGNKGRLTQERIHDFLKPFGMERILVCVCGSPSFNVNIGKCLADLGYAPNQYHIFS